MNIYRINVEPPRTMRKSSCFIRGNKIVILGQIAIEAVDASPYNQDQKLQLSPLIGGYIQHRLRRDVFSTLVDIRSRFMIMIV